jgi:hypothetical protein
VACFKILFEHLPEGTEEHHEECVNIAGFRGEIQTLDSLTYALGSASKRHMNTVDELRYDCCV